MWLLPLARDANWSSQQQKGGFAGLRTKRTEIPVGTPWNCLHSSATNANFFTIRAQGLRSTYPNRLALQCETQVSFDRTGKFHTSIPSGNASIIFNVDTRLGVENFCGRMCLKGTGMSSFLKSKSLNNKECSSYLS